MVLNTKLANVRSPEKRESISVNSVSTQSSIREVRNK